LSGDDTLDDYNGEKILMLPLLLRMELWGLSKGQQMRQWQLPWLL
jgi:hypothetical protein